MNPTPYNRFVAITKSDTVDLAPWLAEGRLTDAIFVGATGVVVAVDANNQTCNFTAAVGEIIPIAIRRVNSGSTTADLMVALYAQ